MPIDEDLVARLRQTLANAGTIREVRMFGGLCFMLNGNMIAGTSKRGLLVRVGKDAQSAALERPGTRAMVMGSRTAEGYIVVDPATLDDKALQDWIGLALAFVRTLPPKPAAKPGRTAAGKKTAGQMRKKAAAGKTAKVR
jgi:TfoX/Sxy family transcriptional regulator of competence genes